MPVFRVAWYNDSLQVQRMLARPWSMAGAGGKDVAVAAKKLQRFHESSDIYSAE